jgi:YD repeat-containing protein
MIIKHFLTYALILSLVWPVCSNFSNTYAAGNEKSKDCQICSGSEMAQSLFQFANNQNLNLFNVGDAKLRTLNPALIGRNQGTIINLVSTSTGSASFSMTDIELPGALPIFIQRSYNSSHGPSISAFGKGWHYAFDEQFLVLENKLVLKTAAGNSIKFVLDKSGLAYVPENKNNFNLIETVKMTPEGFLVAKAANLIRTYSKRGSAYSLSNITDGEKNFIQFIYDQLGRIVGIENNLRNKLNLAYLKDSNLIHSISDNYGRAVSYSYDSAGFLSSYSDLEGKLWRYSYNNGRLVSTKDPMGRVFHYFEYNQNGRVSKSVGLMGTYRFKYYDSTKGVETLVTSPSKTVSVYRHLQNGFLDGISVDSNEIVNFSYKPNGSLDNAVFKWAGKEVKAEFGSKDIKSLYPDKLPNRNSIVTDEESKYDSFGNLIARKTPTGQYIHYKYNRRGELESIIGDSGRRLSFKRDDSGEVIKLGRENGIQLSVDRDLMGRISRLSNSSGRSRSFNYGSTGLLASIINAKGVKYNINWTPGASDWTYQRSGSGVPLEAKYPAFNKPGMRLTSQEEILEDGFELPNLIDSKQRQNYSVLDIAASMSFINVSADVGCKKKETCEQCTEREEKICADTYKANIKKVLGGTLAGLAVCMALLAAPPPIGEALAAACAVIALITEGITMSSEWDMYQVCRDTIPRNCEGPCD